VGALIAVNTSGVKASGMVTPVSAPASDVDGAAVVGVELDEEQAVTASAATISTRNARRTVPPIPGRATTPRVLED